MVTIVAFTIPGCPMCGSYKPKLERMARAYSGHVSTHLLNANDSKNDAICAKLGVTAVPVTFAIRQPHGVIRMEGDLSNEQLKWLFDVAAKHNAYRR